MNESTASDNLGSATASGGPAKRIRILIADDHTIFRDGLRRLLDLQADFEIVGEAKDGRETMEMVDRLKPDVLLLDIRMPGIDGLSALQRLSASSSATKVIILTASDDKNEFVQAVKYGCSGIVLKHTATDLLIKSIRKVYEGEIWLDTHTTAAVMRQFAMQSSGATATPSYTKQTRERSPLSNREREIVVFVAQGYKNKEIADKMFISEQTVKNHLHNIFDKLGVSDRLELALYAVHNGIYEKPME
jgi:two-component system, NarL family, nitrate/nitrite response regulator NarL